MLQKSDLPEGSPLAARQELRAMLRGLELLNPDLSEAQRLRLDWLTERVGSDFFPEAEEMARHLADACEQSAVRRAGRTVMQEYATCLESGARHLEAKGEISPRSEEERREETQHCFDLAVVPHTRENALDYCRILNRTPLPKELEKAATAYLRRNTMLSSVLEYILRIMWRLDRAGTMKWSIAYFAEKHGGLDPENVRDILRTALEASGEYQPEFLAWAARFSSDFHLLEYWPQVVALSDRLLSRHGLRLWQGRLGRPGNMLLAQLEKMVRTQVWEKEKLVLWMRHALGELGGAVQRFISLEQQNVPEEWQSSILFLELNRIRNLYQPVLLLANLVLALPDGAEQFAMAWMGLAGRGGEAWTAALEEYARRVVRHLFLLDAKAGRSPEKTIRRLCFGDSYAYRTAMAELDLGSQKFESMAQREKVVSLLAVYYASYRRSSLQKLEVARRYHQLMRMLHEDFLRHRLPPEQLEECSANGVLAEMSTIAAEARRYLQCRRVFENSLEELLAAKIHFERTVRKKRLQMFVHITGILPVS